ncbi:MAG: ComF family protein [Gemella sp.]|nr:ComF family protein [Gemella sp.]
MKCSFCNKEINSTLSFRNLFSSKSEEYCKNCKEELSLKFSKHRDFDLLYFADYPFLRDTIYSIKYFGHVKEAEKFLPAFNDFFKENKFDLVLIAPTNKTREVIRGFNHIKVIADLCKINYKDIFIEPYRLKQSKLNNQRKLHNFSIKAEFEHSLNSARSVLIIDDIFTSGKTMEALAQALLSINNNLKITFLCLAKT